MVVFIFLIIGLKVNQEVDPNLCIHDCYAQITAICNAQAAPQPLKEPYKTDDTLGILIANQYPSLKSK